MRRSMTSLERPAARRHRRPGRLRQDRADGALCKRFRDRYDICAITNDIYTKEDARILTVAGALPEERIMGVETGGCPHTAIREDASINLAAVAEMRRRFPKLDLVLIESGGDNLAATFSPELADITIYVIDVAGRREDPAQGRARHHPLGPADRQQDRPRAARRRRPRRSWRRTRSACAGRGPTCSHTCAGAPARTRSRASSRRRAASAADPARGLGVSARLRRTATARPQPTALPSVGRGGSSAR